MDQQRSFKLNHIEPIFVKKNNSDSGQLNVDHQQNKQNYNSENFGMHFMSKAAQLNPEYENTKLVINDLPSGIPVRNSQEILSNSHYNEIGIKQIENKSVGPIEKKNNEDIREEIFTAENYLACPYEQCSMIIYTDHLDQHLLDHEEGGPNTGNKHSTRRYLCVECGCKFQVFNSIAMHIFDHFRIASSGFSKRNELSEKYNEMGFIDSRKSETEKNANLNVSDKYISDAYLHDFNEGYLSHLKQKGASMNVNQEISTPNQSISKNRNPNDISVECKECGKILKDKKHSDMHLLNFHNTIVCDCCERIFTGRVALKIHKQLIGKTSLTCKYCKKKFENDDDMMNHIRLLHKEYEYDNLESICNICGKNVKSSTLRYHMKYHLSTEVYDCDQCDYQSCIKENLTKHWRRAHSYTKPVNCNYCGKVFKNNDTRRTHIKDYHTSTAADKPFICDTCGKAFKRTEHLQRHQMLHSGEKPFGCTLCDYKTNQRFNVRIHMKTHIEPGSKRNKAKNKSKRK